ncbi:hypothetical protein GCK72_007674 [Caenorhabditis remanei]|uniref:BTB domain-containing protein n=1 Tax=Caenorhabditis remanei TaxID=31234 RepID=A0A6A5HJP2_CAERE|nr:hypothetical protein GCK72_007674 [Caenorhabditis remanei]KAF1767715.1 hypothetical protein GCK72_007674 [Caenorhabditis remanei]
MDENYALRKLNVGGTIFSTTKRTLTKCPGRLKMMVEHETVPGTDENGNIFIDRSPKHFELILNFLRNAKINLPDSLEEVKEIRAEAHFYALGDLKKLCDEKLAPGTRDHRNLKFIKNDYEYMQIVTKPVKPVFVFHYSPIEPDKFTFLYNFDIEDFLKEYRDKFDIYFSKSSKGQKQRESLWWWTMHHHNTYYEACDQQGVPGYIGVKLDIDRDIWRFSEMAGLE